MSRYKLAARAQRDLRAIQTHIAEDNPLAALKVIRDIRLRCAFLGEYPAVGKLRKPGLFSYALPHFPYTIFYRLRREGGIFVVHVYQGARDLDALLK